MLASTLHKLETFHCDALRSFLQVGSKIARFILYLEFSTTNITTMCI